MGLPNVGANSRMMWNEFAEDAKVRAQILRVGEEKVREAFDAVAGNDAGLISQAGIDDAMGSAPLPHAPDAAKKQAKVNLADPLIRFVADNAREQLRSVGIALRDFAQHKPAGINIETAILSELKAIGIRNPLVISGYKAQDNNPASREVRLEDCTPEELEQITRQREAVLTIASKAFGRPAKDLTLVNDEKAGAVIIRSVDDAPVALPTPSPKVGHADFITHHNQALDSWAKARSDGLIDKGNVLVHVDSHSDIHMSGTDGHSIASYINHTMLDGTVNEVYWVFPDDLPSSPNAPHQDRALMRPVDGPSAGMLRAWVKEDKYWAWVKLDGSLTFEEPGPGARAQYREIKIHCIPFSQLDLSGLAGARNVLLDVDLDFFSNSGYDTIGDWNDNSTESDLHRRLQAFSDKFASLQPAFTTICRSPEYTSEDDQEHLLEYFRGWFPEDYIADGASAYGHHHAPGIDQALLTVVTKRVIESNNTQFEPQLVTMLTRRGWPDLARAYRAYCEGTLSRDDLANRVRGLLAGIAR